MTLTTIAVIALQPFAIQGRAVAVGETVTVSPVMALALTYQRKARFLRRDDPIHPKRRKRTYRRRDLTAEE